MLTVRENFIRGGQRLVSRNAKGPWEVSMSAPGTSRLMKRSRAVRSAAQQRRSWDEGATYLGGSPSRQLVRSLVENDPEG